MCDSPMDLGAKTNESGLLEEGMARNAYGGISQDGSERERD